MSEIHIGDLVVNSDPSVIGEVLAGVTVSNPHAIGDPDVAPTLRINPSVADLFHEARPNDPGRA